MTVLPPPHKTTLDHVESHFINYYQPIINFVYPYQDTMRDVNLVDKSRAVATGENVSTCDQKIDWKHHGNDTILDKKFYSYLKIVTPIPVGVSSAGGHTNVVIRESGAIEIWGSYNMMGEFMPCKNIFHLFFLDKTITTHLKNPGPIAIKINEVGGGSVRM